MANDEEHADGLDDDPISPMQHPPIPARFEMLMGAVQDGWSDHLISHGALPRYKIGRFDALLFLKEGGFGVVFKVLDPELDREVALKLCNTLHPAAQEAFAREAKLLAKFAHPNIVRVFEVGTWEGENFYVMELVEGSTGHELIYDCKNWLDAVEHYEAAGAGLAAAHDRGIVHGDFKPSNVLIADDGRILVADFGLAQVMGEDSGLRHQLGTLAYMAPEVLRGEPGDARADQWSFCVSLWETLDGVPPFAGETVTELLEAIESGEPRVIEDEAMVPEALRAVIRVGLSIDPGERYPDMHALLLELEHFKHPPPQEPPPEEPNKGKSGRGVFLMSMILGFGMVLGAVGAVVVLWPWGEQVSERAELRERDGGVGPSRSMELPRSTPGSSDEGSSDEGSSDEGAAIEVDGDKVTQQVLGLIENGQIDDADTMWQLEWQRRHTSGSAWAADTVLVARGFFVTAELLEAEGSKGWTVAAKKARTWSRSATSVLQPPKEQSPAAAAIAAAALGHDTDQREALLQEAELIGVQADELLNPQPSPG